MKCFVRREISVNVRFKAVFCCNVLKIKYSYCIKLILCLHLDMLMQYLNEIVILSKLSNHFSTISRDISKLYQLDYVLNMGDM